MKCYGNVIKFNNNKIHKSNVTYQNRNYIVRTMCKFMLMNKLCWQEKLGADLNYITLALIDSPFSHFSYVFYSIAHCSSSLDSLCAPITRKQQWLGAVVQRDSGAPGLRGSGYRFKAFSTYIYLIIIHSHGGQWSCHFFLHLGPDVFAFSQHSAGVQRRLGHSHVLLKPKQPFPTKLAVIPTAICLPQSMCFSWLGRWLIFP